jgi:signal transduction histidine kinase
MNLFFKIFLWFMAAIALMVGVVVFLNWTVQTEPVVSRWQASIRNQTNIYADTAAQIYRAQGGPGVREFLARIQSLETVSEAAIVDAAGQPWLGNPISGSDGLIGTSIAAGSVQLELSAPDTALTARSFRLDDSRQMVLVVRWERVRMPSFFGDSQLRYLRYLVLLLTAIAVCYALALYLSSPIGKIRKATQKLAAGELETRVGSKVGKRRDELAALARDFDVMAERIENLVDSQKRLSRDVSHELRSPLARLNVALELAKSRSNGVIEPLLQRIETESQRLNDMIGSILTLSHLESGSQDFEKARVDLNRLLESVVVDADFEAAVRNRSVRLEAAEKCAIYGSERLLRSAVENVLRNAIRYTAEGTAVAVRLGRSGAQARIEIEDHGGGVPPDELSNLFRPFYRIGEARERRTGGTGLGLAIADQAIRAHRGTIEAANTADGLLVTIKLDCLQKA